MRNFATLALLLGSTSMALADDAPTDPYGDDGDYGGPSSVSPEVAPPPPPPVARPAYVGPCSTASAPHVDIMRNHFAIGLNLGGFSVDQGNGDTEDFNITELSLRYRATPHLEIELALTGGRQSLEDGSQGNDAMGGGTLALRYRFAPYARWNWWLMAGLGETTIAAHDSTKAEREQLVRPHGQFGVGLERRFQRFALQAELRMVSLGQNDLESNMTTVDTAPPSKTPGTVARDGNEQTTGAGQFTFGLSYYF